MQRSEFQEYAKSFNVIPVDRKLIADGETPIGIYRKLAKNAPSTFLLESAEHGELGLDIHLSEQIAKRP